MRAVALRCEAPGDAASAAPAPISNRDGRGPRGRSAGGKTVEAVREELRGPRRRLEKGWDAGPDWRSDRNWRNKV